MTARSTDDNEKSTPYRGLGNEADDRGGIDGRRKCYGTGTTSLVRVADNPYSGRPPAKGIPPPPIPVNLVRAWGRDNCMHTRSAVAFETGDVTDTVDADVGDVARAHTVAGREAK